MQPSKQMSLKEIVTTINSPIKEEHAWAILYQGITQLREVSSGPCYLLGGLGDLLLTGNGTVHQARPASLTKQ